MSNAILQDTVYGASSRQKTQGEMDRNGVWRMPVLPTINKGFVTEVR